MVYNSNDSFTLKKAAKLVNKNDEQRQVESYTNLDFDNILDAEAHNEPKTARSDQRESVFADSKNES